MATAGTFIILNLMKQKNREHFSPMDTINKIEDKVGDGIEWAEQEGKNVINTIEKDLGYGVNTVKGVFGEVVDEVEHILDPAKTKPGNQLSKNKIAKNNHDAKAIDHENNTFSTQDLKKHSTLSYTYIRPNVDRRDEGYAEVEDFRTESMKSGQNIWASSLVEAIGQPKPPTEATESAFLYNMSSDDPKATYEKVNTDCSLSESEKKYIDNFK